MTEQKVILITVMFIHKRTLQTHFWTSLGTCQADADLSDDGFAMHVAEMARFDACRKGKDVEHHGVGFVGLQEITLEELNGLLPYARSEEMPAQFFMSRQYVQSA